MKRGIAAAAIAIWLLNVGVSGANDGWGARHGCLEGSKAKLAAKKARIKDCLERCSCGYGKTHNDFGCTGWKGECKFIFGSCWEFFDEPCRRVSGP